MDANELETASPRIQTTTEAWVRALSGGNDVEKAVDCSANAQAWLTCIQPTRKWGKICFIGEAYRMMDEGNSGKVAVVFDE